MSSERLWNSRTEGDVLVVEAGGAWTASNARTLEPRVEEVARSEGRGRVRIDAEGLDGFDTFGACLLQQLARGRQAEIVGLPGDYRGLYDEVVRAERDLAEPVPPARSPDPFAAAGSAIAATAGGALAAVSALGALGLAGLRILRRPGSFRLTSFVHHIDRVCWQAVPIILLITFLIGGIIAQQGFFHFRRFGADDYVVDLVGILVLRELGVLIVAIMVAGRSGSSYTAELGSMKMREEIDALQTMGRDPVEVLVLPRVLALIVALPALTFVGSISALVGGGLVAWSYGGMSPTIFVARLWDALSVTEFEVGMIKAPFMALIIGLVGCGEGLAVAGSAQSLGLRTTASVVKSIFFVIVLDGFFAVFFSSIGM